MWKNQNEINVVRLSLARHKAAINEQHKVTFRRPKLLDILAEFRAEQRAARDINVLTKA